MIAQLLAKVIAKACIEGEIDTKPNDNGCSCEKSGNCVIDGRGQAVQYDCSVSNVEKKGKDKQKETTIPHCDLNGAAISCWKFVVDTRACKEKQHPTKLVLKITHRDVVPSGTHVEARCVVNQRHSSELLKSPSNSIATGTDVALDFL